LAARAAGRGHRRRGSRRPGHARRIGQHGAAGGPGTADTGGTDVVPAARRVRAAVRGDSRRGRPVTCRGAPACRARPPACGGRPATVPATHAEQRELVAAFAAACAEGDLERLVTMLDPDVVWRGDGGGKVASRPGAQGAERVAAALLALTQRPPRQIVMATVNGAPGLVLRDADGVLSVISFTVDQGRIAAIDVVRNPDKLTGVREPG